MSLLERLHEARRRHEAPQPDPWYETIKVALKDLDAMSTVALLSLVGARPTTSNSRRLAAIMRDMKFVPIQSRRLMPGGYRDTVTRGWAKPMRSSPSKVTRQQDEPVAPSHLVTSTEQSNLE